MITLERLKEVLEYNPESGVWVWRASSRRGWAGKVAGSISHWGYIEIRIDGRLYKAQRLAWLYMTGSWPRAGIDHKNLVQTDNRWVNLREATQSQNSANRRVHPKTKSGLKGVYPNGLRWEARISGKYLGLFKTPEEAHAAYVVAAKARFGEFARE